MNQKSTLSWTIFVSIFIVLNFGIGYAAEFEIEDIITAIKKDIQTVMMTRTGSPNFEIENVKVGLTVVSSVTQIGSLVINVAGFDHETPSRTPKAGAYHKLSLSFTPSETPGFSPESSFGLVVPINKIISSLKKAYNNPPSSKLDTLKITLKFAIEKERDGGFNFNIVDVINLKSRNIAIHSVTLSMKLAN
ncbi:MAG: hypothetical protein PVG74_19145 [Desulfobacterales bacterium]|jgi:hypothetical protein